MVPLKHRSYGVTVSTLDSESSDRGSNPRRTLLSFSYGVDCDAPPVSPTGFVLTDGAGGHTSGTGWCGWPYPRCGVDRSW